jgi:hypothetical protein
MKTLTAIVIGLATLLGFYAAPQVSETLGTAPRILTGQQGGTGIGTAVPGDVGNCLSVADDSPFTWQVSTCGSGGGGGNSKWATSTNTTDIQPNSGQGLNVNASSTFTANLFSKGALYASSTSLFSNGLMAYASSTFQRFTGTFSTTTSATTTTFNLLNSTGNITVGGLNATSSIVLTAGGGTGNITGPAVGPTQVEFATNLTNTWVMDYASSTLVAPFCAFWNVTMPNSYDGGSMQAQFFWTATTSSGTVNWGIRAKSFVDGNALDAALSATSTVTDTLLSANQLHVSTWSAPFTPTGAVAGPQLVTFHVCRGAGDTLDTNTRLMQVLLGFKKRQFSD